MMDSINYILHKTYALDKIEKTTLKNQLEKLEAAKAA